METELAPVLLSTNDNKFEPRGGSDIERFYLVPSAFRPFMNFIHSLSRLRPASLGFARLRPADGETGRERAPTWELLRTTPLALRDILYTRPVLETDNYVVPCPSQGERFSPRQSSWLQAGNKNSRHFFQSALTAGTTQAFAQVKSRADWKSPRLHPDSAQRRLHARHR